MTQVMERLQDLSSVGTPNIWVIDSRLKLIFTFDGTTLHELEGDLVSSENPHLELTRDEIFQE